MHKISALGYLLWTFAFNLDTFVNIIQMIGFELYIVQIVWHCRPCLNSGIMLSMFT